MADQRGDDALHLPVPRDARHGGVDAERHREQLAELEAIGVNWLNISVASHDPKEVLEFIEAFGSTYIQ